jgi:hypothetical protein|tara:strand:- start:210 stop:629 length:420 start_codon:yes stop_codon:yes gene_type:complete
MKKVKHIMDLPTNTPRLKKGAGMIELPDGRKYFPGGNRIDEFGKGYQKEFNQAERHRKSANSGKIVKPTEEQASMKIKQAMSAKDRKAKDLQKYREKKKDTFLGLGIGIKDQHPDNIDKKTPYKNMDLLGKQKKKGIYV